MYLQTSKKAYKRHQYSGRRKSLKRVRGGLRQFYDVERRNNKDSRVVNAETSRLKVWRSGEAKKKPVKEEIDDNSIVEELEIYVSPDVKVESGDIEVNNEEPENNYHASVAVKLEPSDIVNKEQAQSDPISLDVKTEPQDDLVDIEELEIYISPAVKVEVSEIEVNNFRSSLFGDTENKAEVIEIHEEGVS